MVMASQALLALVACLAAAMAASHGAELSTRTPDGYSIIIPEEMEAEDIDVSALPSVATLLGGADATARAPASVFPREESLCYVCLVGQGHLWCRTLSCWVPF